MAALRRSLFGATEPRAAVALRYISNGLDQSTLSTYLPARRASIYKAKAKPIEPYLCIRV